jgi:hypothetical protein
MRGSKLSALGREVAKLRAEADARNFMPRWMAREIRQGRGDDWAIGYDRSGIPPDLSRVDPGIASVIAAIAERAGPDAARFANSR